METREAPPTEPCSPTTALYAHTEFWLRPDGGWCCATCHPPPGSEVERYTVETDQDLEELYARRENTPHWAKEWAQLQDRLGIQCYGYDDWGEWADSV